MKWENKKHTFPLLELINLHEGGEKKECFNRHSALASVLKETSPKIIFLSLSTPCHDQFLQDFPRRALTV